MTFNVRYIFTLLAGFSALTVLPAGAAQQISLEQAIQFALKQNRSLEAARLTCAVGDLAVDDARSPFRLNLTPSIETSSSTDSRTAAAGLSLKQKTLLGTEVEVRGTAAATDIDDQSRFYRDTVVVSVQQPLLRSASPLVNREPITSAESHAAALRREMELRKTDLVVQVAETYETLLRLQNEKAWRLRAIGRLEMLWTLTRIKERQGRATRVDTMRAEIKLGEAKIALARSVEQLVSTLAEFTDLLGFPPASEFEAVESPVPVITEDNLAVAVQTALSNRLDYAQVIHDSEDARRGVLISRRNLLPDMNLAITYSKFGDGENGSDAASMKTGVWLVGLEAKTDLPQRTGRNAVRKASVESLIADIRTDVFRDAVERQVMVTMAAHERSRAELDMAGKNCLLAQRSSELARRMLERGRGDSFAASDAEDQLEIAETQRFLAQAEASVTAFRLLRVTGTLVEYPAELKPRQEAR